MNKDSKKQCGICHDEIAKYKCPKCNVMYCSLKCYKDTEKHNHNEENKAIENNDTNNDKTKDEDLNLKSESSKLVTEELNDLYQTTPEIQDLLKYNTVKFHLNKVYRILTTADSNEMNAENKRHLAIEYLNTLRYGGIYYNEAIEEFCQISINKLNGA